MDRSAPLSDGEESIERLGSCLYEQLEHLDPGVGEYVGWDSLRERDRELYRQCIHYLFDRRSLILDALNYTSLANNNSVDGASLIGENTELGNKVS